MNDAEYIAAIAEFYKDGPSPEFRAHYERLSHISAALAAAPAQTRTHPETGEPMGTDAQEATAWRLACENKDREIAALVATNTELERVCDATYVATGADAYYHACDELERYQSLRAKAGKEVGTTHSLCDGMGWVYGRLDALEREIAGLRAALSERAAEVHEAKCPALTGAACTCEKFDKGVDAAWVQFCAGMENGQKAPYPGMIGAFERYYGQSFADKDWRNEASVWAAAWKAALAGTATHQMLDLKDRLLTALERASGAESALRSLVDECDNDSHLGWEERMTERINAANHLLASEGGQHDAE